MNKNYDAELAKNIVTQHFSGKAIDLIGRTRPPQHQYYWI